MKFTARLFYKSCKYWRCYLLLIFASILSFFLIFLSQNDPKLENYFPYFVVGSKYYNFYVNGGIDKMRDLMDLNKLDYEFMNSNSRFCLLKSKSLSDHINNLVDEDFEILNGYVDEKIVQQPAVVNNGKNDTKSNPKQQPEEINDHLDFIFLVISEAGHFKHRNAIRSTWAKHLTTKYNSKLAFFIGNPFYNISARNIRRDTDNKGLVYVADNGPNGGRVLVKIDFGIEERGKLEAEMREHDDIVQIDMSDHENFTSVKSLVALRWANTFCSDARQMFVLSDLAVLNLKQFEKMLKNKNFTATSSELNSNGLLKGHCSYNDEKFALALKLFFNDLYKKRNSKQTNPAAQKFIMDQQNQDKTDATGKTPTAESSSQQQQSQTSSSTSTVLTGYQGQYCSNLGWILDQAGAQRLWSTSLRTPFMMKLSPAYLNGYLVFKSRLTVDSAAFKAYEYTLSKQNCLEMFETNPEYLLCPENFTIPSRYTSYIATWNLGQKFTIN